MGYIYKIVNDINDKVYVGKTSLTIEQRWQKHCSDAKRGRLNEVRPLYRAIKKHGVEHFQVVEIGEYPDEELDKMEEFWIGYYHGFTDGYNATKGGDGKQLYDHEAIKDELLKCPYPPIIAEKFNCCIDIVRYVAKINNIKTKNYFADKLKKKLNCYDKTTGNFIASFESVKDAARWCIKNGKSSDKNLSGNAHHISVASRPNSNRKTAYGYIWKAVNKDE